MRDALKEIDWFFNERIFGFMLTDLKRSIEAKTNFLTALGCFVYTEAIGTLLPPVDGEMGKEKAKRFYRCLFRFPSGSSLRSLDSALRKDTKMDAGLYEHLRHTTAHLAAPQIRRTKNGYSEFMPVTVYKLLKPEGVPPMWQNENEEGEAEFYIGTSNYVTELEKSCRDFYQKIIVSNDKVWVEYAVKGFGILNKGLIT